MARLRRDASAWLLLWLGRIASALLQVRIVKPTFGRPIYRYDLGDTWSASAEQWVRPDLDEASLARDDPILLPDSQHLPDKVTQLNGEQEPRTLDNEGH